MTSSNAKKTIAATPKKAVETAAAAAPKKEEKKISNTQACANMILQLARDSKHTRNEIVATVSEALTALSVVTVRTMMSDLQNAKYAKRYSTHTISVDKATKIVTVASEIKA